MVRARRGFTLIELTVVLAVIVTLALVLTPSVANFVNDARVARAQNDSRTIATAILEFYKDNGFAPQWAVAQNGGPGSATSRLDILISPGNAPGIHPRAKTLAGTSLAAWLTGRVGLLADQLMSDTPAYATRTPGMQFGWNGPYLSSAPGSDPWGNRYIVNIGQVDLAAGNGLGTTKFAVWVLSAGPNGIIETLPNQPFTSAMLGGDDIGQRLQYVVSSKQ
jgi:prepilin-type N-terminal cleavage/methylation domain-containing protein